MYIFILYTLYICIFVYIFRDYLCKNFKSHLLEFLIIHKVPIRKCLLLFYYNYFGMKFVLYINSNFVSLFFIFKNKL